MNLRAVLPGSSYRCRRLNGALAPSRPLPERVADLERLRDFLKYPSGFDSPKGIDPGVAPQASE